MKRGVRVLVGTRKGAFILRSDEGRAKWEVAEGNEVLIVLGAMAGS